MGYDTLTVGFFFFYKRSLEIVHQAGFTEDGKEIIGERSGVPNKFKKGRRKIIFLIGMCKSLAVDEEVGYKDSFYMA